VSACQKLFLDFTLEAKQMVGLKQKKTWKQSECILMPTDSTFSAIV